MMILAISDSSCSHERGPRGFARGGSIGKQAEEGQGGKRLLASAPCATAAHLLQRKLIPYLRISPQLLMPEVWLRPNRRALLLGMVLPAVAVLAGAWGVAYAIVTQASFWWMLPGGLIALVGIYLIGSLGFSLSLPRVAYEPGALLVYLGSQEPVRVPIDVVEVFFVGQGASNLPKMKGREPETTNIIVRLAESAGDWKHRDVDPRFAHWCEGYITLRGAWCEPIGETALRRLNKRLVEVQRERKEQAAAAPQQESAP